MKYRHKPSGDIVEIVTFDELVAIGREQNPGRVEMPWTFKWNGIHVSHETANCYLIGGGVRFERGQFLGFSPASGTTYRILNLSDPEAWEPVKDTTPTLSYSGATDRMLLEIANMVALAKTAGQLKTDLEREKQERNKLETACNEFVELLKRRTSERENWEDTAAQHARNEDYYRGLLDQIAGHLGEAAHTCDDGSRSEDPLRAKLPELVGAWMEKYLALCKIHNSVEPSAAPYLDQVLDACSHGLRALCLTRDYVGEGLLPAIDGWEWMDAGHKLAAVVPDSEWAAEFHARVAKGKEALKTRYNDVPHETPPAAPAPDPVWCQVEGTIRSDDFDYCHVLLTETSGKLPVALLLCSRNPDGTLTPVPRGFLPTYKIAP